MTLKTESVLTLTASSHDELTPQFDNTKPIPRFPYRPYLVTNGYEGLKEKFDQDPIAQASRARLRKFDDLQRQMRDLHVQACRPCTRLLSTE
jgi:hypothetical protein